MTYGGGGSFSELDYSASDTSSSFDAEIEMPSSDNSNDSDSSNSTGESNNNSEGVKKNNDISESGSTNEFSSDSGSTQTDTKPWNGQGQKTAPPILSWPSSTIPSYRPSSSSSISGTSSSSPTLTVASGSSNGVPWSVPPTLAPSSVGSSFSVSPPASTSGDSDYPVEMVMAPADKPHDNFGAHSTSLPGLSGGSSADTDTTNKNPSPSTTASPAQQSSGSTNRSSSDGDLSATSAVTKSPFFYASIVLGIVGLIGIIAGYRAKRKRNHRSEVRAFRMSTHQSMRTATPASNSRPASVDTQVRFDSHNIAIL